MCFLFVECVLKRPVQSMYSYKSHCTLACKDFWGSYSIGHCTLACKDYDKPRLGVPYLWVWSLKTILSTPYIYMSPIAVTYKHLKYTPFKLSNKTISFTSSLSLVYWFSIMNLYRNKNLCIFIPKETYLKYKSRCFQDYDVPGTLNKFNFVSFI